MLHPDLELLRIATDGLMSAALMGQGWTEALTAFGRAAAAPGAVVMRNQGLRLAAVFETEDISATVADYKAGRRPPNSRETRVRNGVENGFRIDHDDYTDHLLAKDPYYQEFLRPAGFFWHANLILAGGPDGYVELSLKRSLSAGPYNREDALVLDVVAPDLRAAAWLARRTFDAEARGLSQFLRQRGDTVLELDRSGKVIEVGDMGPIVRQPFRIARQQFLALDPAAQAGIDKAIAAALGPFGRVAFAPLGACNGRRYFLQVLPTPRGARAVFPTAAAIAVVIDGAPQPAHVRLPGAMVAEIFNLTDREADVASRLCEGLSLTEIARELSIQPGTVRTHLKAVFEKSRVSRQAELVALLARLQG